MTTKTKKPKPIKATIVYPKEQLVMLYFCEFEFLGVTHTFVTTQPSETTKNDAKVIGTRSVIVREGTFDFPV